MQSWKKWMVFLTAFILVFHAPLTTAHASEKTVYDNFHKNSQQDKNLSPTKTETKTPSMGLYVLQFIGSFLLIIGILYVILKFVSRKTKMLNGGGVFHAIGGHSLGNHRSLQLLMVGDTLYILGVGESINLIQMIPPGEEQTKLLESVAQTQVDISEKWKGKWDFLTRKTKQEKWDAQLTQQLKDMKSDNQDQS